MFVNDFKKEAVGRPADEFSRYCRQEGLDRLFILNSLRENKKNGQRIGNHAKNTWKLFKSSVMVFKND
jgi:hypothetical protein